MKLTFKLFFTIVGLLLALSFPAGTHIQPAMLFAFGLAIVLAIIAPVKKRTGYTAGMVTQYGLQDAFMRAKETLRKAGLSEAEIDNAVLSQSEIRLEQLLNITQNSFQFPILVNAAGTAPVRPTEVRLNQQDAFFCSNISIYLAKAASAADTAFDLDTYPNIVTFPVGGVVPAPLNTFYNGQMRIVINKSTIVPNYPIYNFYQVPQTQRVATATPAVASQFDPAQVSLWNPTINFIGTKQNSIFLDLPSNISAIDTFVYAVIKCQGILAQNVTLMS